MLTIRSSADDMQMTYMPVDDILDDVPAWGRCSGWRTCLQMTCRWRSGWHSGWHLSSASQISNEVSLCTSSACRPHEISTQRIFPLKEQTALLKIQWNIVIYHSQSTALYFAYFQILIQVVENIFNNLYNILVLYISKHHLRSNLSTYYVTDIPDISLSKYEMIINRNFEHDNLELWTGGKKWTQFMQEK